jgi:hypothetical protein
MEMKRKSHNFLENPDPKKNQSGDDRTNLQNYIRYSSEMQSDSFCFNALQRQDPPRQNARYITV